MTDIVIDTETLGTKEDSVIVAIGAVAFDPKGDEVGTFIAEKEWLLDIDQANRKIYPDTLKWWLSPSRDVARKMSFDVKKGVRLGLALKQLEDFIRLHKADKVWACSPSFDMTILENAYQQHNVEFPVKFWNWADIRTLEHFIYGKNTRKKGGINWVTGGVSHTVLIDCYMEARLVQNCYKMLQGAIDR